MSCPVAFHLNGRHEKIDLFVLPNARHRIALVSHWSVGSVLHSQTFPDSVGVFGLRSYASPVFPFRASLVRTPKLGVLEETERLSNLSISC